MQSSTVTQEPTNPFGFVSQLGSFVFNHSRLKPNGNPLFLSSDLFFDSKQKPKAVASLSLSSRGASFGIRRALNDFNRVIKFHCERIPLGFASVGLDSGENNGFKDDGNGVLEESEEGSFSNVVSNSPKKVLILMSDTGGGHRASAEAIRAAFSEEFGDEYQVFITDLWTDHTPWPFNQLPKTYNFLVKHGSLWRLTYYFTAPRLIHQSNFAATGTFIARYYYQRSSFNATCTPSHFEDKGPLKEDRFHHRNHGFEHLSSDMVSQACDKMLLSVGRGSKTSTKSWPSSFSNKGLRPSCAALICKAYSPKGRIEEGDWIGYGPSYRLANGWWRRNGSH